MGDIELTKEEVALVKDDLEAFKGEKPSYKNAEFVYELMSGALVTLALDSEHGEVEMIKNEFDSGTVCERLFEDNSIILDRICSILGVEREHQVIEAVSNAFHDLLGCAAVNSYQMAFSDFNTDCIERNISECQIMYHRMLDAIGKVKEWLQSVNAGFDMGVDTIMLNFGKIAGIFAARAIQHGVYYHHYEITGKAVLTDDK